MTDDARAVEHLLHRYADAVAAGDLTGDLSQHLLG